MMKDFIIFGKGDFADIVRYIIEEEMQRNVVAYMVNSECLDVDNYCGKPVVPYEKVEYFYNPFNYAVSLAYEAHDMYQTRKRMQNELSEKGFLFDNVISNTANITNASLGTGNIIMQNCVLAPFSQIGNGNVLWATSQIQHHNSLGNYNCLAPGVALSGYVRIGDHCFIGTNSSIKNSVEIANYSFIGAGAYVSQNTKEYEVVVPEKSRILLEKSSLDFGH